MSSTKVQPRMDEAQNARHHSYGAAHSWSPYRPAQSGARYRHSVPSDGRGRSPSRRRLLYLRVRGRRSAGRRAPPRPASFNCSSSFGAAVGRESPAPTATTRSGLECRLRGE